jgi:hypothetical protein
MKNILIIIFLLLGVSSSFAQEATFAKAKSEFDSFQYEKMVKTSNDLLVKGNLTDSLKVEVYIMRAVAFYSLGDDISTRSSFENILKIRRNYSPDPAQISPKLISIFGEVKAEFIKNNPLPISITDSTSIAKPLKLFESDKSKYLIFENLAAPGIGQLQLGKNPKGIILTAASTLNLAAMIYFLIDTKNKENDYLSQTEESLIQQKYNDYNKSYKIRNTLIISYALIWIYSQIDLLFLNEDDTPQNAQKQIGSLQYRPDLYSDYKLNIKIPF